MSADQILHLSADDDLASLRERLRRTRAQTVILIVPNDVIVLRNAVNVRLMRRYADQMAMELVIVSRDRATEQLARRQGFAVYSALEKIPARSLGGLSKDKLAGVPSLPPVPAYRHVARLGCWVVALAVVAAAVIVLGLLAAFLAPTAIITIVPATEPVKITLNLLASPQIRVIDSAQGQFPAKPVQILIEDTGQVETTGQKRVPDATARGNVVFANRSQSAVTIPKGTTVSTASGQGLRFRTDEEATLGAGASSSARVPITAVQPGPLGNVKAGTINIVEGTLTFQVGVLNDEDISGGTEKQIRYVTQRDRNNLRDAITKKIQTNSYNELRKAIQPDDILAAETLSLAVNEAIFDKAIDAEGSFLTGKVRATVSGLVLNGADLKSMVAGQLGKQVNPGFVVLPQGVTYGAPANVKFSDGIVSLQIVATARSQAKISVQETQQLAAGKTIDSALQALAQMPLAGPPQIELERAFFGRLPMLTSHITVIVNGQ